MRTLLLLILVLSNSFTVNAQVRSRDYERMRSQFYSQIKDKKLKDSLEKIENDILKELEVMDGEVFNANTGNAIIMELYRAREEITRVEVINGREIVVLKGLDELRDDFESRKKRIFEQIRERNKSAKNRVQAQALQQKTEVPQASNDFVPAIASDTPASKREATKPHLTETIEEKNIENNDYFRYIPWLILVSLVGLFLFIRNKKNNT